MPSANSFPPQMPYPVGPPPIRTLPIITFIGAMTSAPAYGNLCIKWHHRACGLAFMSFACVHTPTPSPIIVFYKRSGEKDPSEEAAPEDGRLSTTPITSCT